MPKSIKYLAVGTLAAFFIYCLLGFLLLPGIALHLINSQLEQRVSVPARLDSLEFNPFSLELRLGRLHIGETDDPLLSFEHLNANLQINSLWRDALQLESLTIQEANLNLVLQKAGTLNLTQVLVAPENKPPSDSDNPDAGLFAVRIERLALLKSQLDFQDRRPATPVQANFDGINLEVLQFSTVAQEHAQMSLLVAGPSDSELHLQASLGLVPLTSAGTIEMDAIPLSPFWPYLHDLMDLRLRSGSLTANGDYQIALSDKMEVTLDNASATLSAVDLATATGDALAKLPFLQLNDTSFNLSERSARVGSIRSRELEAWISRTENGTLNWQAVMPKPDQSSPNENTQPKDQSAWHIKLPEVQLRDYHLYLSDQQPETPVSLELSSLNLDVTGFDSVSVEPFALDMNTTVTGEGHVAARGQAQLNPASVDLKVEVENIDLRLAQAYLNPLMRIELREGYLSGTANVAFAAVAPPSLNVTADATIADLHILDTIENRDLLKWDHLQLDKIAYGNNSLSIDQASLVQPYVRIIINQDLSTNLGNLLVDRPEKTQDPGMPMGLRIGGVNIDKGAVNFADFSLQPNVVLSIEELAGRLGTLNNQNKIPAELSLSGQVDRYAPVTVDGSLTPFDPLNSLDVTASFKDIELTTLSPYARKFAGYRIRKGRLNLDLHYLIEAGELNASNEVLLSDLQLGERVESATAVDLPIRLAVALLKDAQGNINITLPVQGNLNNPEFNIMPVIWRSFGNLLSRAATAPFRFIANLVGGENDDDISHVRFAAGSAKLDNQAKQRLDSLGSALLDRPALRLEIEGMSSPITDGPLVAQQRLEREYVRRWQAALEKRQGPRSDQQSETTVPEQEKPDLLEAIYLNRLGLTIPEEWTQLEPQARTARMRLAVLETWQGSDALLRRLAQERNASIKAYLVESAGLEPSRVQLLDVGINATAENAEVLTALHLGVD
jgi:hypothetical protein